MTNMIDEGIVKCVQYWPEAVGDREQFGHICIQLTDVQVFANFTIYKMAIWHESAPRTLRYPPLLCYVFYVRIVFYTQCL